MSEHGEKQKKYARLQTRAFSMVLEIIAIFGLPALLAVFIGKSFADRTVLYILLGLAFIFSWVILFIRIKSITRELERTREEIKKEKDNT